MKEYKKNKGKKKLNQCFRRERSLGDISKRNPLTKKHKAYLHVYQSLLSFVWSPYLYCIYILRTYLCICGSNYLSSGRIPSAFSSRITTDCPLDDLLYQRRANIPTFGLLSTQRLDVNTQTDNQTSGDSQRFDYKVFSMVDPFDLRFILARLDKWFPRKYASGCI